MLSPVFPNRLHPTNIKFAPKSRRIWKSRRELDLERVANKWQSLDHSCIRTKTRTLVLATTNTNQDWAKLATQWLERTTELTKRNWKLQGQAHVILPLSSDGPVFSLSAKGKYFLAKHQNSCVRNFNHSAGRGRTLHILTPGPGMYEEKQEMSPEGKYFVSKIHNSQARRFGTSNRQPLAPKSSTPGPGNYRIPSEFGHYLAKNSAGASRLRLNKRETEG